MATVTERQRRRRTRLREAGLVEATVTVPQSAVPHVKALADDIAQGRAISGRLIPAIRALQAMRDELRRRGVVHAGVFGSVARGEEHPNSDVDVFLRLDLDRAGDALDFVATTELVAGRLRALFPENEIDVIDLDALRPAARAAAEAEAIHAF